MKWIVRVAVLLILIVGIIRMNPYTPEGAIRLECFQSGYVISSFLMQIEKTEIKFHEDYTIYKVTRFAPYERPTNTHLDQWNVIKEKSGRYKAAFGYG